MDMTPYSNYLLCMGTLRLCRRITEEHPELWAQICAEAEQAEAAKNDAIAKEAHNEIS